MQIMRWQTAIRLAINLDPHRRCAGAVSIHDNIIVAFGAADNNTTRFNIHRFMIRRTDSEQLPIFKSLDQ